MLKVSIDDQYNGVAIEFDIPTVDLGQFEINSGWGGTAIINVRIPRQEAEFLRDFLIKTLAAT